MDIQLDEETKARLSAVAALRKTTPEVLAAEWLRQASEHHVQRDEAIRARLIAAERSVEEHGWVNETPQEMLDGFKEKARRDGTL